MCERRFRAQPIALTVGWGRILNCSSLDDMVDAKCGEAGPALISHWTYGDAAVGCRAGLLCGPLRDIRHPSPKYINWVAHHG